MTFCLVESIRFACRVRTAGSPPNLCHGCSSFSPPNRCWVGATASRCSRCIRDSAYVLSGVCWTQRATLSSIGSGSKSDRPALLIAPNTPPPLAVRPVLLRSRANLDCYISGCHSGCRADLVSIGGGPRCWVRKRQGRPRALGRSVIDPTPNTPSPFAQCCSDEDQI